MTLSSLAVPLLLAFVACYAARRKVDVYAALTHGAEEGLTVLLHILPSLVALLSAVYMFRASGAMEALGALFTPALARLGIPAETAPLLYYGAAGITKTRYTIPAALCADAVMFLVSAKAVTLLMGA